MCGRHLQDTYGFQLAVDPDGFTVATLLEELYLYGSKGFVADFDSNFKSIDGIFDNIDKAIIAAATTLVSEIEIKTV